MIVKFLEESLTVNKFNTISDLKKMVKKNYPPFPPGMVKDRLDDFFDLRKFPIVFYFDKNDIDMRYRKYLSVFGKDWFVLGRLAYYSGGLDNSGYYQKVLGFNYEKDEDNPNGEWYIMSSAVLDGGYHKCMGQKEDIPFMFRNLEVLFKLFSKCSSSEAAYHTFGAITGGDTIWKPVR